MNTKNLSRLGFLNFDIVDLKYFFDTLNIETLNVETPRYLYIGIDLLSGWEFVELHNCRSHIAVRYFLEHLIVSAPFTVKTIFTDKEMPFTNCLVLKGEEKQMKFQTFSQACLNKEIIHLPLHFSRSDQGGILRKKVLLIMESLQIEEMDPFENFKEFEYSLTQLVDEHNASIDFEKLENNLSETEN